jgi:hypothetical protein
MKPRTTLILLAITALFFGYMYFYEKNLPSSDEAKRQSQNVVNITPEKIDGMVIQNGDDKIELRRHDKKWRLESPIKDQADNSLVDSILSDIESWQKDTTISAKEIEADKNRLNEYGLNKPKLRLKLMGPDAPPEILLGKDAALEGKMYVRFENAKDTFVVSQAVKKAIEKKPDDFRDKKLTDLNTTQVTRVIVKSAAGELELEKKGEHWELVRPLRARGDDQKIGDLLAQITTAHIQQFVADDRGDLHPYGLAEPRGAITLFGENDKSAGSTNASRGEQGQMLQIGGAAEKQKDQVYVRFAPRGFVYTLPKKIEEVLNAKPNDLRDRHLVRIDKNNLDRITIEAEGKPKTVLARKNENWSLVSRSNAPANGAEAVRLVDTLNNEQVTKFVEDVASNLARYGLDKPQLRLTFSSFASENTAETKAGEQPFATIAFGKVEGDSVYARVGDEPFILAVPKTLIDSVYSDPLQWQDLTIFNLKPEQIHQVTSKTANQEQTVVRATKNEWKVVKGDAEVNGVAVQSLLNTLTRLHAVRWAGATIPQHGFDKPSLTINFTSSPDDKAAHKLTVGAAAPNGMWFAKVDEREGTFILNNPDLNALRLPLTQARPAAASASPGGSAPSSPISSPAPRATPSPVATATP